MTDATTARPTSARPVIDRYGDALLGVFGTPQLVLARGEGAYVWDVDGQRYLDLLGGIAVNALGHNHPALVSAISKQAGELVHISNFYTSVPQVRLAEELLRICAAPTGSRVFFCNSGAEAIEAAIKLSRRTGRREIVALESAFHGRTTGALALTHKAAYREPFEPLLPGVRHVPAGDIEALRSAVSDETAAVILEPIQGEAGVRPLTTDYLRAAREITSAAGALLIVDEIQTGMGRTGEWFGFCESGIQPDAICLAKGLGGGLPIGALVTFGADVSALIGPGQHGSTFGGNPLAAAAGLAVIETIDDSALLAHVSALGEQFAREVAALDHPHITATRGKGLLQAIVLARQVAADVVAFAREAGFLINAVAPDTVRLAPPLVLSTAQLSSFIQALPALVDQAVAKEQP